MNAAVETLVPPLQAATESDAQGLGTLVIAVDPLTRDTTIEQIGELFLAPATHALLSLPVVENERVIGIVSRYQLMQIYMKMYGREVYGRRPVERIMNTHPLTVDAALSVEAATQSITERMRFPVMDDFVITRDGRYIGMGVVLHLLGAMERRVQRKNEELATAYARLQSSQAHLIQSEKMASLGQMVAGVTHEINTPLGYVRNNIEMLLQAFQNARALMNAQQNLLAAVESEAPPDEAAVAEHLAVTESYRDDFSPAAMEDLHGLFGDTLYGVDQIGELVMNLKNFSRLDQSRVENVNLNDCVDSALVIGRNNLKHKARVVKKFGELPLVKCSPSQINQVFLNLLTNAAQAMQREGTITVTTWRDIDAVCVAVADDGTGIPAHVLPRIFDPFFTTKPVGEGTGLGLAICYQILEQHGGRIDVQSEEGRGTTFTVRLPVADCSLEARPTGEIP